MICRCGYHLQEHCAGTIDPKIYYKDFDWSYVSDGTQWDENCKCLKFRPDNIRFLEMKANELQ